MMAVCHNIRAARAPLSRSAFGLIALILVDLCSATHAYGESAAPTANRERYRAFISEASQRFGIPSAWLQAVLQIESSGNARALSPKGAMGLMQIMPDTWVLLRARYRLGTDPFDPHDNITAGAAYLKELLDRFGTSGFLAAYNAGPRRFEDYLAGLRPLRGETKDYLAKLSRLVPELPLNRLSADADWRTANLFTDALSSRSSSANAASVLPNYHRTPADGVALVPQANGLFIAVSAAAH
jgi:soluble lytic murein transglycosylase-like protein